MEDALRRFRSPDPSFQVTLVRPSLVLTGTNLSVSVAMPLGLAYLGGALEAAGYRVSLLDGVGMDPGGRTREGAGLFRYGATDDEILEQVPPQTRILCVSLMFSSQWVSSRQLIRRLRAANPQAVIVVGGEHVSALCEFTLRDCPEIDYAVCGEGEVSLLALARAISDGDDPSQVPGVHTLENGEYQDGGLALRVADIDQFPRPAWHLVPVDAYRRSGMSQGIDRGFSMPLLATRGCPFQCTFCSSVSMWTTRYRMRSPRCIVDEVESLVERYQVSGITLCDLTAFTNKKWILEFCRELERREVRVHWQLPGGTRSESLDRETLEALYRIQCHDMTYAPESGSERTLERIQKKVNLTKMIASIREALDIGFSVKVNLIIGFPFESRRDIFKTLWLCLRLGAMGVTDCFPWIFSPYPGTALYRDLRRENQLPPLGDAYFNQLHSISDVFNGSNGSVGRIPPFELAFYRLATTLGFYAISYVRYPKRLWRVLAGIWRPTFRPQSLFEQRLAEWGLRVARARTQ